MKKFLISVKKFFTIGTVVAIMLLFAYGALLIFVDPVGHILMAAAGGWQVGKWCGKIGTWVEDKRNGG